MAKERDTIKVDMRMHASQATTTSPCPLPQRTTLEFDAKALHDIVIDELNTQPHAQHTRHAGKPYPRNTPKPYCAMSQSPANVPRPGD